jgi:two-component system, OmpR family, sensor kinase
VIKSLRTQLTLWYVGVLAAVLLLASAAAYYGAERILTQRMDTSLLATADEVVRALSTQARNQDGDSRFVSQLVEELGYPNRTIWLLDANGRVLAEKKATTGPKLQLARNLSEAGAGHRFYELDESQPDADDSCRGIVERFATSNGSSYILVVTQSTETISDGLDLLRGLTLFVVPLAVFLAAAGGWFLARRSLAPIASMAATARQITANNLGERLPVHNPQDEIGSLATLFNQVLERLSGALTQQRQFMTDASHELRTPLSVIRTAAEVTLEPAHRQESEYREALGIVKQQVQRLTGIVENMFALASAEMGQLKLYATDFYLDEVVGEAVTAAAVLAARKQIKIELRVGGEAPYRGDEGLLRQMLMNLLENAIKFTPQGGSVLVSLKEAPGKYVIQVADTGTGISPDDQPYIFDRFFRADKARSEVHAENGAGLGLSITRSLAELHGGQVQLESSGPQGSAFVVSLPRALAETPK